VRLPEISTIGDFLKEIDLTDGKSTGFPIIRDAMADHGNPEPFFHADKDQILTKGGHHAPVSPPALR